MPYSAMNNAANLPAENSMLNPETSSDSASTKSKGARFASARHTVNHISATGRQYKHHQTDHPVSESAQYLIPRLKKTTTTKIILIQIS
jgi:uncharacterized damage-inducible protein DinB